MHFVVGAYSVATRSGKAIENSPGRMPSNAANRPRWYPVQPSQMGIHFPVCELHPPRGTMFWKRTLLCIILGAATAIAQGGAGAKKTAKEPAAAASNTGTSAAAMDEKTAPR